MKDKSIYIILMNTGTLLSKTIRFITRYKYSHVVLSLDDSYKKLYSFGRKTAFNFLNAGFVTYGIDSKFFRIYKNTECIVYEVKVDCNEFAKLNKLLDYYESTKTEYKYDIKGLLFRYFGIKLKQRENYYVCSQFVAKVLLDAEIGDFEKTPEFVKPEDFSGLSRARRIYEGKFLSLK